MSGDAPVVGRHGSASSSETTRRANLSLVLSLVHHSGALSRAEITRMTGLNRSTIATLVAHLGELGLVYETAAATPAQIGRPSPTVRATSSTAAIAVNPEIDAVTIGLVGLGGEVIRKIRFATEQAPSAREVANITAAIVEGMRTELEQSYRIVGIGVAVPGLTRADDGVVSYAPHLGWRDEPIAAMIAEATGFAVSAANDASLGAGAELLFGAGKGSHDLIYLNGGASGIGGGVISNGVLRTGRNGYAGELGHTLVNSAGVACHCGASGCLETEVSLARLQRLVGLAGADLEVVEAALHAGTPELVLPEIHRQLDFLAIALRNAVNVFNPERVILGGFLATVFSLAPDYLIDRVTSLSLHGPGEVVQISRAVLGTNILMIGAAELALSGVLADPLLLAVEPVA
ncbi:ROK family transcriptional regulator [Glaciihabitans arcticus]|uniref:ROK family transcriptional regulator n=1 Tax=Glaciihabitans arcticus TaxID=2668039 RepID=A0A4Q9GM02_9MICO|nr:ROK family transcriptional regulator [Glaciihabitans arcticus]TBN55449.1 ROK family transcriptional regulator [Glaciihabitans arcticus]